MSFVELSGLGFRVEGDPEVEFPQTCWFSVRNQGIQSVYIP